MPKFRFSALVTLTLLSRAYGAIYTRFEDVPKNLPFDFVIIGGGTAGNTLANRLTENSAFNVLVIEAGPSNVGVVAATVPFYSTQVAPFTPYDWNYTTVPQSQLNNRQVVYPRGHILGGSSSVNYMAYLRGSSEDWNRYASIAQDSSWNWNSVQQYFLKNEKWTAPADNHNTAGQFNPAFHSTKGINAVSLPGFFNGNIDPKVIQTTKDLSAEFPFNQDMNSGSHLGVGWCQATIDSKGRRSSSATSYLGPSFISRKNLKVLVNAKVTRLVKTGTSSKGQPLILGVEFVNVANPSQKLTVQATKEVILSAGSVNSVQLLQLSGIGDQSQLTALKIPTIINNPSVGRNLSDHPLLANLWLANSNQTFEAAQRNATLAAQQFAAWQTGSGPLVDTYVDHLAWLRVPSNVTATWSNIPDPAAGKNTAHYEFLFSNGLVPGLGPLPPTGSFFSIFTAVVSPASRGTITLASADPLAAPLIDPGFFTNNFDLQVMKYAIRSAQRFLAGPAWTNYIISPVAGADATTMAGTDAQLEAYIRANTGTVFHPVGTASMSPVGAKWGVVDPDLKVKGACGLRVVDLSVLPRVPAAHTQGPAYVVGEKAADLIKQTWSSSTHCH